MGFAAKLKPGLLLGILLAAGTYAPSAYAYLDPGTGSILLQGLIAALAGGLMAIKLYWKKLKAKFASRTRDETELSRQAQDQE